MILSRGWYDCEDFGVWMRGEEAQLSFLTAAGEGTAVIVYLEVLAAPQAREQVLTLETLSFRRRRPASRLLQDQQVPLHPNGRAFIRLAAQAGAEGVITLGLRVDRPATATGDDERRFCVGLVQLGWAPVEDVISRQEISEGLLLGP